MPCCDEQRGPEIRIEPGSRNVCDRWKNEQHSTTWVSLNCATLFSGLGAVPVIRTQVLTRNSLADGMSSATAVAGRTDSSADLLPGILRTVSCRL